MCSRRRRPAGAARPDRAGWLVGGVALCMLAACDDGAGETPGPGGVSGSEGNSGAGGEPESVEILEAEERFGSLVFAPGAQAIAVEAGTEIVEATIAMRNTGAGPVTIEDLESGCACLELEATPSTLEPGARGVITGVFDLRKLTGKAEKTIAVSTDERADRRAFLTIRIDVEKVYEIEPEMVEWRVGDNPETRTIVFRTLRDEPVRLVEAVSMRDSVRCEWETVEEGREYHIHLTPDSTESSLLGFVRLQTDLEIAGQARALAYFSIQ